MFHEFKASLGYNSEFQANLAYRKRPSLKKKKMKQKIFEMMLMKKTKS